MNLSYSKESNDKFLKRILKERFNSIPNIKHLEDDYAKFKITVTSISDELTNSIIKKLKEMEASPLFFCLILEKAQIFLH